MELTMVMNSFIPKLVSAAGGGAVSFAGAVELSTCVIPMSREMEDWLSSVMFSVPSPVRIGGTLYVKSPVQSAVTLYSVALMYKMFRGRVGKSGFV